MTRLQKINKLLRAFQFDYNFATLPYTKSLHECAQNNFANVFSALSGQTFFFRRNPILLCL